MKNKYIKSNNFYIKDDFYSFLIYFDYFLSPGFPLAKHIHNRYIRKIIYYFLRLGLILLYISKLYKLRYKILYLDDNALVIFNGPGKWGSIIKLIKKDKHLRIVKKVFNKNIYINEKKFYDTYKDNSSNIKLPEHVFLNDNTIEIEFLKIDNFQKIIINGSLNLTTSLNYVNEIKKELKIFYGTKNVLIHGDLWPGNIFIKGDTYYLIDYGDSYINNYNYDLYVLIYSILSTFNYINNNNPIISSCKVISVKDFIDVKNDELKKIEEQFIKFRQKRFPNIFINLPKSLGSALPISFSH